MTTQTTPSILLIGATGTVGSELSKQLAAKAVSFRALVRNTAQAPNVTPAPDPTPTPAPSAVPGAQLVPGDLEKPETLLPALAGIERVFLLTNSSEKAQSLQTNFIDIALRAGVKHIVKLSQFAADPNSPVRFLRYHAAVEQKIKDTGLTYTFLRPNLYMQGLLGFRDLIARGGFYAPITNARVSAVDIRDIAAVAAEALTQNGHENKVYDLTGPRALTHAEMAEQLAAATGHPLRFTPVSPEQMLPGLITAGFPAWQAEGLIEDYAHYARGEASLISTAVQDITGKPARDFTTFAKDHAIAFS